VKLLLAALGRRPTIYEASRVALLFGVVVTFVVACRLLVPTSTTATVTMHALIWAMWFTWQALLFPRNRDRFLRRNCEQAYRKAFYVDVLPGVSIGLSQMFLTPSHALMRGTFIPHPLSVTIIFLVLLSLGLLLLVAGFASIGLAAAGFVFEYRAIPPPVTAIGIYAIIRHPLFLGGVIASSASALVFDDVTATAIALLNAAILPIYAVLEDRRLIRVFGSHYRTYASIVPAFIPRSLSSRSSSSKNAARTLAVATGSELHRENAA
jgi:protein-S-isoprenylcysteine O-methyltransferase Ste14